MFLLLSVIVHLLQLPIIKAQPSSEIKNNTIDSLSRLSENTKDSSRLISIYRALGTHYFNKSFLDSASFFFIKSTKIAEELKNDRELMKSYGSLANVYDLLQDPSNAQFYRTKAYRLAQKNDDKIEQIKICFNMSTSYLKVNQVDSATIFAQRAVEISEKTTFYVGLHRSLTKLAECYLANKKPKKALQTIKKTMKIPKSKIGNNYEIGTLYTYSKILKENRLYTDAKENIYKTINLLTQKTQNMFDKMSLQDNYYLLSSVYAHSKKPDSADIYHKKGFELGNKIIVDKIVGQASELQTQYETEKKEQKIINLKQENKIKALEVKNTYYILAGAIGAAFLILVALWIFFKQKSIIERYEKEQAKLRWRRAQLNPHFFFNVLSALQTLMYEKRSDEAIEYAAGFSILMRKVLEESNKEKASLEEEMDFLDNYLHLEQLSLDFEYNINCTPEDLDIQDILIPTMILQPFVENAVEHGLRKSPKQDKKILISITEKSNDLLQISVRDNGVGRNKKRKKNHISRALEITEDRKKLMKGKFDYHIIDHEDKEQNPLGTEVILTLSI